jgi:hypothetical protein
VSKEQRCAVCHWPIALSPDGLLYHMNGAPWPAHDAREQTMNGDIREALAAYAHAAWSADTLWKLRQGTPQLSPSGLR